MRPSRLLAAIALSILTACSGTEPPTIASVAFSTDGVTMIVDDLLPTPAVVTNSRGETVSAATVSYTSSDESVATVNAQGGVQALAPGTTTITATISGFTDQLQVMVVMPTVKKVELSIVTDSVLTDESLTLVAVVTDVRDKVVRYPLTYGSSATDVVAVSATGVAKGMRTGVATVTVTADTAQDTAELRVKPYFTEIATGGFHTCGITPKGATYCWGAVALGRSLSIICPEIGLDCSTSLVQVQTSQRFVKITAGQHHVCALNAAAAAYCWGENPYGELGIGAATAARTPAAVTGGLTFTSITAGRYHTCGIVTTGDTYCWGSDWQAQIGAGQTAPDRCTFFSANEPCALAPMKVAGGFTFVDLAMSDRASCGRTSSGAIYCWGLEVGGTDPTDCQGTQTDTKCTRTPLLQVSGRAYAALSVGPVHSCGHLAGGTLECWGANYYGMFGNGTENSSIGTPVPAAGGMTFTQVVSGWSSVCGLTAANAAFCWGHNGNGTVGDGSTVQHVLSPSAVAGSLSLTSIMLNSTSGTVCGVSTAGRAYCWGDGRFGQLGQGALASSNVPVLVKLFP